MVAPLFRGPRNPPITTEATSERDVRRLSLVKKFVLLSLAAIVPTGVVLGLILARQIESRALSNARQETALLAQALVVPLLSEEDLHGLSPQRSEELDRLIRHKVLPHGVAQVKVWSPGGTVVYSNNPEVIGKTFPLAEDLQEALDGETVSEISDPDEAEHAGLERLGQALEVYAPLRFGGRIEGVFEIYRPYRPIAEGIRSDQQRLYLALAIGMALLFLLLGRIVRRASRDLVRQADELSELYSRERETLARLREVDELKTDIVAAVSHELRTPLTSIRGAFGTLMTADSSLAEHEKEELLQIGIRNSERLDALVGELLEVPQLDTGDRKISIEPVAVEALLSDVADRHDGRVTLHVDEPLPVVHTDRGAVGRILALLVDNALKFSPDGSPVTVKVSPGLDAVRISVQDQGPGIPSGQEERIFEPFYQVDHGTTRRVGGVGLGLHLARKLAAAVDGQLTVGNGRSGGATFVLSLPVPVPARPS
jgi:signal transduction histidine kinase